MPDVDIKPQRYRDERPKEHFDRYHDRVRAGEPEAHVYETVRVFTVLYALSVFRARGRCSERVPGGPLIVAPNHASFMDHFFAGAFVRRRIQFMAKSQLFAKGIPQYIFSHGGVFPVRRGAPGRGGVHQRLQDPRARRGHRHVLRGRALAHGSDRRRGAARDRAPGAGVRSPGGSGGDPRLPSGPQLEAAALPPGDRLLRRAVPVRRRPNTRHASSSRRRRITSSSRSAPSTPSCRSAATEAPAAPAEPPATSLKTSAQRRRTAPRGEVSFRPADRPPTRPGRRGPGTQRAAPRARGRGSGHGWGQRQRRGGGRRLGR